MLTSKENVSFYNGINAFCGACHTDYNTENIKIDQSKNGPNGSGSVLSGIYGQQHTRHQVGMVWKQPTEKPRYKQAYLLVGLFL